MKSLKLTSEYDGLNSAFDKVGNSFPKCAGWLPVDFAVDSPLRQSKRHVQRNFWADAPAVWRCDMAKPTTIKIRLNSSAGTGHFYVTKKNARTMTEKMVVRKYDPVARKHVEYKEGKIK